jgi:hypothetical protein
MPFDESERDDLLDRLVEEFAARLRRGERPALKDYADRYPELADEIRDVFPAMAQVEQAKEICQDWRETDTPSCSGKHPVVIACRTDPRNKRSGSQIWQGGVLPNPRSPKLKRTHRRNRASRRSGFSLTPEFKPLNDCTLRSRESRIASRRDSRAPLENDGFFRNRPLEPSCRHIFTAQSLAA